LYFKRLKKKWNITSNYQLILVFIVFGITGSLSAKLAKPLLDFFNIYPEVFITLSGGKVIYWILRIFVVFPIYQILLLIIGALFFQFRFFWEFEKKIFKRMGFKCFFKKNK
tara:strand:- start:1164 stop:1496 length:333 start_codon:yes stop_codon:yes gene_type:complete